MGSLRYTGFSNFLVRMGRREGWTSYWRGNAINLWKIVGNSILRYNTYSMIKKHIVGETSPIADNTDKEQETQEKSSTEDIQPETEIEVPSQANQIFSNFMFGTFSGAFSLAILYPFDTARTRIATDITLTKSEKNYHSSWNSLSKTMRYEGVRGILGGLPITLAALAPYVGITFAVMDYMDAVMPKEENSEALRLVSMIGVGSIAATVAQTLLYPLDTIRRRMQVNGSGLFTSTYTSSLGCAKSILASEGIRGFYRGVMLNIVKTLPQVSLQLAILDEVRKMNN